MIKVNERGQYSLMNIVGDFNETDLTAINKSIRSLIEKKNHLIVNLALAANIKDSFFQFLKTLNILLSDQKKCIVILSNNEEACDNHAKNWLDDFETATDLLDSIEVIKNSKVYQPSNFIKELVGRFMLDLLVDYNLPSSREKIFIKDKVDSNHYLGDKTLNILLTNEDIFFHLSVSFTVGAHEKLSETENFTIHNLVNQKISELLKKYSHLNLAISEQIPGDVTETLNKNQEIQFKDQTYKIYDKGITVVIPLESFCGTIYFELWIPEQFQNKVLEVINS